MWLCGYLRCNPSYTNVIGVEIVATKLWSELKMRLQKYDQSWKYGNKTTT
jgi:hypothetical protein